MTRSHRPLVEDSTFLMCFLTIRKLYSCLVLPTVDGSEIQQQLRLVDYTLTFTRLYIPGGYQVATLFS